MDLLEQPEIYHDPSSTDYQGNTVAMIAARLGRIHLLPP